MLNLWRRAFLVLCLVFVCVSETAGAEPVKEPQILEQEIEGGIRIVLRSITKSRDYPDYICVEYVVLSSADATIKISSSDTLLYDNLGNEFRADPEIHIGNAKVAERYIVGNVETPVKTWFLSGRDYKITSLYPRIVLSINGKELLFRAAPGEPDNG